MQRFLLISTLLATIASADTVTLTDKPPFERVTVTGFANGRLAFRGLSGETIRRPIEAVSRIEIDESDALGAAERAARDENWDAADAGYLRAAAAASRGAWLRDLARTRRLLMLERSGRFAAACEAFATLRRDGASIGDRPPPRIPPTAGIAEARAALEIVSDATGGADVGALDRAALRSLQLELLIATAGDLPSTWIPGSSVAGAATQPATAPANEQTESDDPPPLMFGGPRTAESAPGGESVALRPGTPVLAYVMSQLDRESSNVRRAAGVDPRRRVETLERSIPFFERTDRPLARLLLGRARIATGDPARAAEELLGLATTEVDRDLTASAMYYVGLAHERLARADVAAGIYRELLERPDLRDELRAMATQRAAELSKVENERR